MTLLTPREVATALLEDGWNQEEILELEWIATALRAPPSILRLPPTEYTTSYGIRVGPYLIYPEDKLRTIKRHLRLGAVPTVHVFGDGSGTTKGKPTGIGSVLLLDGQERPWVMLSEHYPSGTSSTAELMALIRGLQEVADTRATIYLWSDSQYALGVGSGQKTATANLELVNRFRAEVAAKASVSFNWIKGHASCEMNHLCDNFAGLARKKWEPDGLQNR